MDWKPAGRVCLRGADSGDPNPFAAQSIAMGATNGVAILLSQAIGAGETRRTRTILFTSFILSIVFSLGMTGLLEGMVSPLLRFLQVPSELYEMTCLYLRIYLIGYGAFISIVILPLCCAALGIRCSRCWPCWYVLYSTAR